MSVGETNAGPASNRFWRPAVRWSRLLPVLCTSACYLYVSPEPATRLAGREVDLPLTDSGSVALAPVIGPRAESVTGRVIEARDSALVLALEHVRQRDGQDVRWRGEQVTINRSLIDGAGQRAFSPVRTALFSGLVAAAFVVARQAFAGHGSGGGGAGVGQSGSPR